MALSSSILISCSDNDRLTKITARIPEKLLEHARALEYVWADATELPLAESSFDAVWSIYFTDVIPLDVLFKKTRKILRENGYFIHIGPLQYHHSDMSQHLSQDDLVDEFARQNFEVVHASTDLSTQAPIENRLLSQHQYVNSLIVARYLGEGVASDE